MRKPTVFDASLGDLIYVYNPFSTTYLRPTKLSPNLSPSNTWSKLVISTYEKQNHATFIGLSR